MKINPIVWIVAAIIVLGGLFMVFLPKRQTVNNMNVALDQQVASPSADSTTQLNAGNFELVIKDKRLVSGPETLKVTEGDTVTIKIISDEDEEFHIHGYDNSVDLEKDRQAEVTFTANLTGRFVYELENSKVDIGALEVSPK